MSVSEFTHCKNIFKGAPLIFLIFNLLISQFVFSSKTAGIFDQNLRITVVMQNLHTVRSRCVLPPDDDALVACASLKLQYYCFVEQYTFFIIYAQNDYCNPERNKSFQWMKNLLNSRVRICFSGKSDAEMAVKHW